MTREFWNETWAEHEDLTRDADDLLVAEVEDLAGLLSHDPRHL